MKNVIQLSSRDDRPRKYPRRLFECADCGSRMFKIHETDGEKMVECANCEALIELDCIFD